MTLKLPSIKMVTHLKFHCFHQLQPNEQGRRNSLSQPLLFTIRCWTHHFHQKDSWTFTLLTSITLTTNRGFQTEMTMRTNFCPAKNLWDHFHFLTKTGAFFIQNSMLGKSGSENTMREVFIRITDEYASHKDMKFD